ncbi:PAS domain-containing sensor histidine kinase [Oryzifoliimicrobium ureilyticus]|uniref:PAS domain-containing sensor histidine kinase n=1 Tax=Oryzifoliimicrobium ureilyticus TaxID=3113724 RepID=UPI0030762ADD
MNAIHSDDRAYAERQWREAMATRRQVNAEFRLRAPDGGWRWTNVLAAPLLNERGDIAKWVGLNIDIDMRRRAEEALRASEDKYRTLFEGIDEGFCVLEILYGADGAPRDCLYVQVNPAFLRQTGQRDPTGKLGSEYAPASAPTWLATYDAVVRSGDPVRFEQYHPDSDRWYSVYACVIGERGSRLVASVFADITERKRAEILARQRGERQAFLLRLSDTLRALADEREIERTALGLIASHIGADRVYITGLDYGRGESHVTAEYRREDLAPMVGNYRHVDFSEGIRHITGSTLVVQYIEDGTLSDAVRQSLKTVHVRALICLGLGAGEKDMFWALTAATATTRAWTDNEIQLIEEATERTWTAIERARSETALRDSEARFQQFAKASAAGMWIRDAETLAMEYVSPAIARIYGVEPNAFLGDMTRWAALILPEDREVALRRIGEARHGEAVVHEFRIQRHDNGTFRWIRNTDFPLFDTQGRVERIGGLAEDVTEAKLLTEHQGVLLAELQHRVRNIMAMIRSTVVRSADGAVDVEDYRTSLAGRLLALARVQTLLTRQDNAGGSLRSILESEISAQAHSESQYELTGPDIMLSPKAVEVLTLAFHELSTNALKYGALSVSGGKIFVRWKLFEKREKA